MIVMQPWHQQAPLEQRRIMTLRTESSHTRGPAAESLVSRLSIIDKSSTDFDA